LGRRGMLELDLLFENLRAGWGDFSVEEQGHVTLLATCEDADLLHWWLGMAQPQRADLQVAVAWLRAKNRPGLEAEAVLVP